MTIASMLGPLAQLGADIAGMVVRAVAGRYASSAEVLADLKASVAAFSTAIGALDESHAQNVADLDAAIAEAKARLNDPGDAP